MRLSRLMIANLRRIGETQVDFAPATFLIGQNNHGKSTVLKAIEMLLSDKPASHEDFRLMDGVYADAIRLTGYFTDVGPDVAALRGFRGRVIDGQFCYRRTYALNSPKPQIECLEYPYDIKPEYRAARKPQDLLASGFPADRLAEAYGDNLTKSLKDGWERDFLDIAVEFDPTREPTWKPNPGGISGNVLSRLPQVLTLRPATTEADMSGRAAGELSELLGILYADLINDSEAARQIAAGLAALQTEASPATPGTSFYELCQDINETIGGVFPGCGIKVVLSVEDLEKSVKPQYDISLYSNVETDVGRQGTGLLRTAAFAMLRYHARLKSHRADHNRSLIILFEEPEIYLHPSAANLMRDTIYELAQSEQIVCTTHSPWMIDLSRDMQSLTKMSLDEHDAVTAVNYGLSEELARLGEHDRDRVRMLQVFDDEVSRVFFCDRVVVVEGDSELVAIRETMKLLSDDERKAVASSTQVVRARGKASIISLVRYLRAFAIEPYVIHDRDLGKAGAVAFNQPISDSVGDPARVAVLAECLEDALGYTPPDSDKPFQVYRRASTWGSLSSVPSAWLAAFRAAFGIAAATDAEAQTRNLRDRDA